jgi:formylglycine-generating enzyme required for sulfatase activity
MKRKKMFVCLIALVVGTLACGLGGPGGEESGSTQPSLTKPPAGETVAPTAQVVPTPGPDSIAVRPADGMEMVLVPAGEFLMGNDESAFAPEKPAHLVTLDDYWIDRYEVTNAQYRLCLDAGVCAEPELWWNDELNGDDQPALVNWEEAQAYCGWVGARLPTEAEWEKAARGVDGRMWPWGNEFEPSRANLHGDEDGYGPTAPVGSFPGDASPYGLLDVAGNASEWVADWFDPEYYDKSPARNPVGPAGGERRVHRGTIANAGGGPEKSRCVARYGADPSWDYGFRCAASIVPEE